MLFTADHIRTLANWAQQLKLTELQTALFTLYHEMTVTNSVSDEKVNAIGMSAVKIIRDSEKDKELFYSTMSAWGIR